MYDVYINLITRYMGKFDLTVYNVIKGYLLHPPNTCIASVLFDVC